MKVKLPTPFAGVAQIASTAARAATRAVTTPATKNAGAGPVDSFVAANSGSIENIKTFANWVADAKVRGNTIGIDEGREIKKFNYGQARDTFATAAMVSRSSFEEQLSGGSSSKTELQGGRVRLFGELNKKLHQAALGVEAELGSNIRRVEERDGSMPADTAGRTESETFFGARGRAFAEAGELGATWGDELFAGVSLEERWSSPDVGTGKDWKQDETQVTAGLHVAKLAHVGLFSRLSGVAEVGVRARRELLSHQSSSGDIGTLSRGTGNVFIGAIARTDARANPFGVGANLEACLGIIAEATVGQSLTYQGTELLGGFLKAEVGVGVGVKANLDVGYDREEGSVKVDGSATALAGIGGGVGGGFTFAGVRLWDELGPEASLGKKSKL